MESDIFFIKRNNVEKPNRKRMNNTSEHMANVLEKSKYSKKSLNSKQEKIKPQKKLILQKPTDIFNLNPDFFKQRVSRSLPKNHHLMHTETTGNSFDTGEFIKNYKPEKREITEYSSVISEKYPKMKTNFARKQDDLIGNYYNENKIKNPLPNDKYDHSLTTSFGFMKSKIKEEEKRYINKNITPYTQRNCSNFLFNEEEEKKNQEIINRQLCNKSGCKNFYTILKNKEKENLSTENYTTEFRYDVENAFTNKINFLKSNIFNLEQKDKLNLSMKINPKVFKNKEEKKQKVVPKGKTTPIGIKFDWKDSKNEIWQRKLYMNDKKKIVSRNDKLPMTMMTNPALTAAERKKHDLAGSLDEEKFEAILNSKNLTISLPNSKEATSDQAKIQRENRTKIHYYNRSLDKLNKQIEQVSYMTNLTELDNAFKSNKYKDSFKENNYIVKGIKRNQLLELKKILKDNGLHTYSFLENNFSFAKDSLGEVKFKIRGMTDKNFMTRIQNAQKLLKSKNINMVKEDVPNYGKKPNNLPMKNPYFFKINTKNTVMD